MTTDDILLGLKLTRQAGWNQLEADWRRFLAMQPDGCFIGELGASSVGTTVTCILGPVAWIAMVLVDTDSRRQGVATALLKHSLAFLDGQGVRTVRLDATAAGRLVYEKLGFTPEYRLTRYVGTAPQRAARPDAVQAGPKQFAEIFAFDREVTATDREKMLSRLFKESPHGVHLLRLNGRLEGYVSTRSGTNAIQIGPCVAALHTGETLLADALGRCAGQLVFIDVPQDNGPAVALVEAAGLKAQRDFTRMCRGEQIGDQPQAIWASSGPEKG
ncbi:MAG: GNAT family N-acetyltransferase [Phycisphaerae bacterium]|nr:GNAT family N-acetyltransferase [Phycisphaerae bacterium]